MTVVGSRNCPVRCFRTFCYIPINTRKCFRRQDRTQRRGDSSTRRHAAKLKLDCRFVYQETSLLLDEAPATWTSLIPIPISPPRFHLGIFFVHDLLWFDRHVDDVGCKTIGETRIFSDDQYDEEIKNSRQYILPDNRDLSLSILPIEIKRMDSGLDGLASHSGPKSVSDKLPAFHAMA